MRAAGMCLSNSDVSNSDDLDSFLA